MLLTNVDVYQNNIFIDEDWHARLADFGLAGWSDATLATSTSNHAGSARWMAPELHTLDIFRRTKFSDVYAFACVSVEVSCFTDRSQSLTRFFFQIYSGKYPFYDILRDVTVIWKVTQGGRPQRPTNERDRTMSNELWDLVEMCWKQEPQERPQMGDVVDKMVQMSLVS